MKITILALLLGMALGLNAQEYNKYLIKPKKMGGSMYYYTNEKYLGDWYSTAMSSMDLDRHPNVPQIVFVNLDKVDMVQAGIEGTIPEDMVFNTYAPQRLGIGVINTYGKFFLPPYYTQIQSLSHRYVMDEVDRYFLLGRKLKNGNWLAVTFDNDNDIERVFNSLPEMKDYTLLTKNVILFKDKNSKYGLMDFMGNVKVEAQYDTCYADFEYPWFPDNSKTNVIVGKGRDKVPASLQHAFNQMAKSYSPGIESRTYNSQLVIIYLMKNKQSTLMFSDKYTTKPVKNARVTQHKFNGKGFFLLRGSDGEYDIIDVDGTAMDDNLKYAYYETIRRDTTSGMERAWVFDPAKDYSKPFTRVNYDSIQLAEVKKKEAEAALKAKADQEAKERRRLLENDPSNYSTVVAGNYAITEFTDGGVKLSKTGYNYETNLNCSWTEKNKVDVSISFKGMFYTTDAQFHTYKISLTFGVQKAVLNDNSFNISAQKVNGYVLTTDGLIISDDSPFSSTSGTYNPLTREIIITAVEKAGGSITIRGVKE